MRKTLLVNTLITLLLIIIFDVGTFNFLPSYYVAVLPDYRRSPPPVVGGRGTLPVGYFVAHDERGFDIDRNKNGHHWTDGITYPIWSNSIGCFDNEHSEYDQYVYFAGDSFTWGFTPFDKKFGTIVDRTTDTRIFKCGVTSTGQRHQYEKMVEVVKESGKLPKAIFVFFYSNDVDDDFVHPRNTVIHGWLVEQVYFDNNTLTWPAYQELKNRVEAKLDKLQEQNKGLPGWWSSAKRSLKYYSLSVNILDYLKDYVEILAGTSTPPVEISSTDKGVRLPNRFPDDLQEKNGVYWYSANPMAERNKAAVTDFKRYSIENNTDLVVVLIPPLEKANDTDWYVEVRDFLAENKISYLDLASKFRDKGLTSRDLYWVHDGHLNALGNKVVAEILIDEFPHIFQHQHTAD